MPDQTYDVEQYDEIMAAYTDARQKMNDMRLAGGFYPVVAMVPPPTRSTAPIIPRVAGAAR
eukprot:8801606-Pyramimonas_sp.AAC.1